MKVLIIGAGSMAREHCKAFTAQPGVEIVGIHSRTTAKAEALAAEFGISKVITKPADMYRETEADIAVITVNIPAMLDMATEVVKHPWVCLFEKPVGLNYAEAIEIEKRAAAGKAKCFVGLNRRHYSSTRQVLAALSESDEKRIIQVFDQEDPHIARVIDGHPDAVIKNWMYANSIHMIDYFCVLGRGPVTGVTPVVAWNPDQPELVVTRIDFASGDVGIYTAVWDRPGPWAVTVTTASRRWEMRPLEQATVQQQGTRKQVPLDIEQRDIDYKAGFHLQAEYAVKAAQQLPHHLPTLADSLATMQLIHSIYEA
jgi:predicted dehydrogenase